MKPQYALPKCYFINQLRRYGKRHAGSLRINTCNCRREHFLKRIHTHYDKFIRSYRRLLVNTRGTYMYMAYIVVHFTMVNHIIGISLIWYEIQTDNKNLLINNSYRPYQNYQQIKCHQL